MANTGLMLRVCDLCGGVDRDPRHVIAGGNTGAQVVEPPGEDVVQRFLQLCPPDELPRLLRDLMDTRSSDRHMDCCRAAGCPNGLCGPQTAGAEDKRGAALRKHLMSIEDPFGDFDDVVKGEAERG